MPRIRRVLAPNPGPFTLQGTNTWIVGDAPSIVIDPGPPDEGHVREVLREAGEVHLILLTHHHPDHAPAAGALAAASGAPIFGFAPQGDERPLAEGQVFGAGEARLHAVHTPGHSPDHSVFHQSELGLLFTGDAVLGRGTSVIDPPEGRLADYIRSLRAMRELQPRVLLPGHGPAVWEGTAKLEEYLDHRELRERQVLEGLSNGPRTPAELVPAIYCDYPKELHPIAARSVLAHLVKLEEEGRVLPDGDPSEGRFALASAPKRARSRRPSGARGAAASTLSPRGKADTSGRVTPSATE
jgi:glyoxylase-like metal-dependent hydrolase (beta-lactamase superfamily II)